MDPFYALKYYIQKNKLFVIGLVFFITLLILVGCGDDEDLSNQNLPPQSPSTGEVISYCSKDQPGVRVYLSDVYYGSSIAVIEDTNCP
jgi:hypothetical protein